VFFCLFFFFLGVLFIFFFLFLSGGFFLSLSPGRLCFVWSGGSFLVFCTRLVWVVEARIVQQRSNPPDHTYTPMSPLYPPLQAEDSILYGGVLFFFFLGFFVFVGSLVWGVVFFCGVLRRSLGGCFFVLGFRLVGWFTGWGFCVFGFFGGFLWVVGGAGVLGGRVFKLGFTVGYFPPFPF